MRKAYFHIGMPKTGTTSIQKSLQASRSVLRKNGLLYPGDEVDHATMIAPYHRAGGAHFWFARRNIEAADALASSRRFIAGIVADSADFSGDLLLSSEYFCELDAEHVGALRDLFAEADRELHIICYVRHPVMQVASSLAQQIKRGRAILEERLTTLHWQSSQLSLAPYLAVLGHNRLHVRSFDDAVGTGLVDDLLTAAGYGGALSEVVHIRANYSLSMAGVLLVDRLNRESLDHPELLEKQHLLLQVGGRKFQLPAPAAALVEERGAEELVWLQATFGIDLPAPAPGEGFSWEFDDQAMRDIIRLLGDSPR